MTKSIYIFDIGNVLLRWDPKDLAIKMKEEYQDFPLEIAEITSSKDWEDLDRGHFGFHEIIKRYSEHFPEAHLREFITRAHESLLPIQEGWDLLFQAKKEGKKIYILSNICFEFRDYLLAKFPSFSEIDGAIFSCDVQCIKPELSIYQKLIKQYEINPEDALFFDDRKENIDAAEQLGIQGHLFPKTP